MDTSPPGSPGSPPAAGAAAPPSAPAPRPAPDPGLSRFSMTELVGFTGVAAGLGVLATTVIASSLLHPHGRRVSERPGAVATAAGGEVAADPAGAGPSEAVVAVPPRANPDGSWPAVRQVDPVATQSADKLVVVRVDRIATEDPFWAAWKRAQFVTVPLMAQQMAMPRSNEVAIPSVRVQGLCDDRSIAWRVEWDDPTPDGNVDTSRFSDAVAVGFPLDPGAPPMMGTRNMRVQILFWKALWQKDQDVGFQDVQDLHPNYWTDIYWFASGQFPYPVPHAFQNPTSRQWFIAHQAGNPMAAFSRTQPIEELVAEGWSTLTHQPHSATSGRGAWVDGKWSVVFVRPFKTTDPLDYTFAHGTPGQVVFAAWDGAAGNRGGRKQWSNWVDFEVQR